ncbi:MAG: hypothetical protein WCD81_10405 [Candidatus Bathyarchaeia archaeon]
MKGELSKLFKKEYGANVDRLLADIDMRRTVKIRRSGNAEAVTLPQKWLCTLGWKEGDFLEAHLAKSKGTVTLQKSKYQENRRREVLTIGQKSPVSEGGPDSNRGPTSTGEAPPIETYRS